MGAYSFLSRRVGPVQAERMITSGRLYSAEGLHTLGPVDVLAEDGKGEAAVRDHIDRNDRKHNALQRRLPRAAPRQSRHPRRTARHRRELERDGARRQRARHSQDAAADGGAAGPGGG
jgi:enoyl-CoA hydratase/carnithine racemase